jgi:glycine cleavage system pyridoxal-binding protein P
MKQYETTVTLTRAKQKTMQTQLTSYRAAACSLLDALTAQNAARAVYDASRDMMEDERRRLLLESRTDPANRTSAEQREAAINQQLAVQAGALRSAREDLRNADSELEFARVLERAEREALRVLANYKLD